MPPFKKEREGEKEREKSWYCYTGRRDSGKKEWVEEGGEVDGNVGVCVREILPQCLPPLLVAAVVALLAGGRRRGAVYRKAKRGGSTPNIFIS